MKANSPISRPGGHPFPKFPERGFALIVTLMLMVLLTIVAVGLLTLASVSLRTSGHSNASATARANARLALMLALGDLQKLGGYRIRHPHPDVPGQGSARVGGDGRRNQGADQHAPRR